MVNNFGDILSCLKLFEFSKLNKQFLTETLHEVSIKVALHTNRL